jgi:protein-disulfide isomerase
MNISFGRHGVPLHWLCGSTGFVLLCIGLNSCSIPTQVGSSQPRDTQLEANVLQVIRKHPEVVLESVSAYQQKKQEQQQRTQTAFLQKMKANPKSVIGESPTTGAPEPKIVLIEFSDPRFAQIQNSKFKVCPSGTLREQKKKKDASP